MPPDRIFIFIPTIMNVCGISIRPGSKIICMKPHGHPGTEHEYYKFFRKQPKNSKKILKTIPSHRCVLLVSTIKKFTVNEQLSLFPSSALAVTVTGLPINGNNLNTTSATSVNNYISWNATSGALLNSYNITWF